MAVNVRDLDPNANDQIVDFVNADDQDGRNGAVVLYSQSNRPEQQSLKIDGPDNAFGRSFAAGTHASGGTGGLNPGQPQGYPEQMRGG